MGTETPRRVGLTPPWGRPGLDLDPKRVAEAVAAVTRTAAEDAMAAMLGARERFEGARAVNRPGRPRRTRRWGPRRRDASA